MEIAIVKRNISYWWNNDYFYHEAGEVITSKIIISIIRKCNHLYHQVTIKTI